MLSIKLITAGGEDYYIDLAADDYYLSGGEPPGHWIGRGAQALKLCGIVDKEVFRRVFRGYHPTTGVGMVQNAGHSDRQAAWDLTFCAPKSVSIIWSQLPAHLRQRIQDFQQQSVEAALRYAEENLVFSRAGKGGIESRKVGLVAATFEHGTSRLLQALLHTHTILMNLGVADDQKVRAIYSKILFRYKKILGAYYRAHLAHLLETELGFSLIRKGDSFEVAGVPEDLIKLHSQRRAEILAYLDKKGKARNDAVAAAEAALKTRRTKKDIPPRSELFKRWQKINRTHGFDEAALAALPRAPSRHPQSDLPQVIASAQRSIARRLSHFAYRDFLFETLLEAPRWGIPPDAVPQAVQAHLETSKHILPLREVDGEKRYTTRAILRQESRLLNSVNRLRRSRGCVVPEHKVERILAQHAFLRSDQALAVRYLTQAKGRLRIICGKAGSGKTTMLRVARRIWRKQGYRVVGATYTGKAANVLQQATEIESDTLHRRLGDYRIPTTSILKHHLKQFYRAARRKRTYRLKTPRPLHVDAKTIVVVDEAGMVNTRQMKKLLRQVQKGGGTLVLLGDPLQLPPVQGSAPFQSICRRAGFVELTKIGRQKEEWARQAVELFANGKPGEALRLFAQHRKITVRESREDALQALVLDWTSVGLTTPDQAAILVSTNQESETANRLCQEKRLQAGCLDARQSVEICDEDPDGRWLYRNRCHLGDRVVFTHNSRQYGVENGAVGTVIALRGFPYRKSLAVKLDDGRRVVIPLNKYPHMRLGYAMTTHKAQGVTVPQVFVLAGGAMQDLPISYVQASRAILDTFFYTTTDLVDEHLRHVEDSPLAEQMSQAPDLTLASDLLPNTTLPPFSSEPSSPTQKKKPRRKRRPRTRRAARQPAHATNPDLTYGMAQAEWILRRRSPQQVNFPDLNPLNGLLFPPTYTTADPQELETQAVRSLDITGEESTPTWETTSIVPVEVILDTHMLGVALQAEVLQEEEECQRRLRELDEERRRQREAAAAQDRQALAEAAAQAPFSCFSILASPSSSPWPFGSMTCVTPCSTVSSTFSFDLQQWLTTGAAQSQWTQHQYEYTTTMLMPR